MNWVGLGQTKLKGGRSGHKTQEGVEKKMRGQNGGEPKQMVNLEGELVRGWCRSAPTPPAHASGQIPGARAPQPGSVHMGTKRPSKPAHSPPRFHGDSERLRSRFHTFQKTECTAEINLPAQMWTCICLSCLHTGLQV